MIDGIDHVQLAAPAGCEDAARRFFGELLGLEELEKPESLRSRGGVWFRVGAQQLHVGVEASFSPARKAHPAFSVSGYDALRARLQAAGIEPPRTTPSRAPDAATSPIRGATESSWLRVNNRSLLPINQVVAAAIPKERILIVDDEEQICTLLARLLGGQGYDCVAAGSAAAGRRALQTESFALLLSDVNMPGESGIDFTSEVLTQYPDTAVVMVTGMDDRRFAQVAIDLGAYGYILKPFKPNELIINVGNALRRRALEIENRGHREQLEHTVLERTSALRESIAQLEASDLELRRIVEETIRRLSWAAEFRNQETGEHIVRMSRYCTLLARLAGLDSERVEDIRIASPLHDVGKIGIPDRIMLKPRPLTADERKVIETHTTIGHRILGNSGVELLDLAAAMALTHHERLDGAGYPAGLSESAIPIEGRITAIADVFDALTSDRVYRPAFRPDEAREMMEQERGAQFDPGLLDLFFGAFDDVLEIRRSADAGHAEQTLARALELITARGA